MLLLPAKWGLQPSGYHTSSRVRHLQGKGHAAKQGDIVALLLVPCHAASPLALWVASDSSTSLQCHIAEIQGS